MIRKLLPLFVAALVTAPAPLALALDTVMVEAEGSADVVNITQEQAIEKAIAQAKIRAISQVTGTTISQEGTTVRTEDAIKVFRQTSTYVGGQVIRVHKMEWKKDEVVARQNEPSISVLRVKLQAEVAKLPPADPKFKVKLDLNKKKFLAGQALTMDIQSTEDAHLMVFNLAADKRVYLIYPNPHVSELKIKKGTMLTIPRKEDHFELQPRPVPGNEMDVEAVKVVATRFKVAPPEMDKTKGSMSVEEFLEWMYKTIPHADRAESNEDYRVIDMGGPKGSSKHED